jgi:hypothetical protein
MHRMSRRERRPCAVGRHRTLARRLPTCAAAHSTPIAEMELVLARA